MTNGIKTFTISTQPFYDQYNQCYKNIMTLNVPPQGPLNKFVRKMQFPRLSPFQRESPCNPIPSCGLVLSSLMGCNYNFGGNSCCDLMTPNEIPDLITFLTTNGYQIETQITNMLNQSSIKNSNNQNVFTVTYYGSNQPNIMYMR